MWGGDKLNTVLNKAFEQQQVGESWEISDVKGEQTLVANGSLSGKTLKELISAYQSKLVGKNVYDKFGTDFPLLIKFIDAKTPLSIQVHPHDHIAKERHDTPKDINHLLLRDFGIDTNPKSYFETLQLPAIPQQKLEKLNQLGWHFSYLSNKHNVLDVSFKKGNVSSEMISNLTDINAHVTWLDLSKTSLTDDIFKAVGQLENLTRLNLSNTNINDTSILYLDNLKHVEVLNLYGTEISDESLKTLEKLDGLKRVYLWGTHVSESGIESLKSKRQDIKVIGASS